MQFFKGIAILAVLASCNLTHSFKFEHEISNALEVARKVVEDIVEDDSPKDSPRP